MEVTAYSHAVRKPGCTEIRLCKPLYTCNWSVITFPLPHNLILEALLCSLLGGGFERGHGNILTYIRLLLYCNIHICINCSMTHTKTQISSEYHHCWTTLVSSASSVLQTDPTLYTSGFLQHAVFEADWQPISSREEAAGCVITWLVSHHAKHKKWEWDGGCEAAVWSEGLVASQQACPSKPHQACGHMCLH